MSRVLSLGRVGVVALACPRKDRRFAREVGVQVFSSIFEGGGGALNVLGFLKYKGVRSKNLFSYFVHVSLQV